MSFLNHLYLMASEQDLLSSLADSYGLSAKKYRTIYTQNFINQYGINKLYREIEDEIVKSEVSTLLVDVSSMAYDPFVLEKLKKKYGVMLILIAIDDEFKFDWISSSYSTIADLVITSDFVSVNRYRQSGVNAEFLPLPVKVREPSNDSAKDFDVSFVGRLAIDKGSRNDYREYLDLPEHNFNVSWFTSQNPEDYLTTDEMYSVFDNSKINLNFTGITAYTKGSNILFDRIRTIKLRPFEILAVGGFCLSEISIGLSQCFKDGEEIVYFRNKKELKKKIDYYLKHPEEASKIGKAGLKAVEKKFSSEAIAIRLAEFIKKSSKEKGLDLYGDPQSISVSILFAHNFIEFAFFRLLPFLYKRQFRLFFNDSSNLLDFIKNLFTNMGFKETFKVIFISIFRISRSILARIKFW